MEAEQSVPLEAAGLSTAQACPSLWWLLRTAAPSEVEEAPVHGQSSNRVVEVLAPVAGGSLPSPRSSVSLVTPRGSVRAAAWPLEADGKG